MKLNLYAPGPGLACDLGDARTISGLALPYGAEGRTSAGTVTVDAGSIALPADLKRVKLFRDHGRGFPVGYTMSVDDTPEALRMVFRAAATPDGDTALLEAAEGVRDALSVELDDVVIKNGHVTFAALTAVALVAIPAFADARLKAADTPTEDEDITMTTSTPPDPQTPPAPEPPLPAPTDPPAPDRLNASFQGGALTATPRVPSFAAAVARIRDTLNGSTDAAAITAALTDVVPANDVGQGYLRDQWLGEIWSPLAAQRHYIPAIGSATLTGMRVYGWKWKTKPVVGPYAGNKTAIPSSPVLTEAQEAQAYRLAGGWDVDRIYSDLGNPGFLEAMFAAAAADCALKTEAHVAATLLAGATVLTPVKTLAEAFGAIGGALSPYGLSPSFVALAPDVWADYAALTTDQVPWWLASSSSVSLLTGTGSIGGQAVFCDPTLPAGTVLSGARQAATYFQAPGSPLRVTAVNVPNGGIDIAVFLYAAEMINDPLGIVSIVVDPALPLAAAATAPAKK